MVPEGLFCCEIDWASVGDASFELESSLGSSFPRAFLRAPSTS